MSRFPELFDEAIDEVVLGQGLHVEVLAERIATQIVERQNALRAEVRIVAGWPQRRRTPVTGLQTQEIVSLIGIAAANGDARAARGRRRGDGDQRVPVRAGPRPGAGGRAARGGGVRRGRGADPRHRPAGDAQPARPRDAPRRHGRTSLDAEDLAGHHRALDERAGLRAAQAARRAATSSSMRIGIRVSSRTRFASRSRSCSRRRPDSTTSDFVLSRQRNLETIHDHDVVAERWGTVGEIRAELGGARAVPRADDARGLAQSLTKRARTDRRLRHRDGARRRPAGAAAAPSREPPACRRRRAQAERGVRQGRARAARRAARGAPAPVTFPLPATETTSPNRVGREERRHRRRRLELQRATPRSPCTRPSSGRNAARRPASGSSDERAAGVPVGRARRRAVHAGQVALHRSPAARWRARAGPAGRRAAASRESCTSGQLPRGRSSRRARRRGRATRAACADGVRVEDVERAVARVPAACRDRRVEARWPRARRTRGGARARRRSADGMSVHAAR